FTFRSTASKNCCSQPRVRVLPPRIGSDPAACTSSAFTIRTIRGSSTKFRLRQHHNNLRSSPRSVARSVYCAYIDRPQSQWEFFNLNKANMDRVPYLDLKAQYASIRTEVLAALEEVCESGRFAQGPATSDFESKFAAYCGVDHCVSLNSGTSALHLALRCLDVGPGDEVITVSMTFIATAWAISYTGATPVFVDIDPVRRTLNPDKLEAAITPRTKAIIPVHLFGMPADMDRIVAIAERHGLPVIEDAAQAHGAKYQNKRVGQFGQIACFSFYPSKN